jgi:hypothetical protein
MRLLASFLSLCLAAPGLAAAQDRPVVVEFFTSQGCVACPPADALFAELAQREGVIALALHVTYWDYQNWPDTFAQPYNDKRQKAYANLMRQRTLFTPQMVIQGADVLVGRDGTTIADRISAHREGVAPVTLGVERHGDAVTIDLAPVAEGVGPVDIQLVTYIPSEEVAIGGGANEGQTVRYTNIVTGWSTVAQWDGASTARIDLQAVPKGPIAVLVQSSGLGPILTAAMLH